MASAKLQTVSLWSGLNEEKPKAKRYKNYTEVMTSTALSLVSLKGPPSILKRSKISLGDEVVESSIRVVSCTASGLLYS